MPRVRQLNPNTKRGRLMRARWREHPDVEFWREYFRRAAGIPFLVGENDIGFCADLEWLLHERNMTRILEGFYARFGRRRDRLTSCYAPEPEGRQKYRGVRI